MGFLFSMMVCRLALRGLPERWDQSDDRTDWKMVWENAPDFQHRDGCLICKWKRSDRERSWNDRARWTSVFFSSFFIFHSSSHCRNRDGGWFPYTKSWKCQCAWPAFSCGCSSTFEPIRDASKGPRFFWRTSPKFLFERGTWLGKSISSPIKLLIHQGPSKRDQAFSIQHRFSPLRFWLESGSPHWRTGFSLLAHHWCINLKSWRVKNFPAVDSLAYVHNRKVYSQ